MRRALVPSIAFVIAGSAAIAFWWGARDSGMAEKAGEHWGLLESYCTDCHNSFEFTAEIAFDAMSPEEVPKEAETWERVVRKLRARLMPPPGNKQPDAERLESFIGWMEAYLDEAAAASTRPGRVGLHRLNRREYANAVRDLLGVEIDPSALLPPDDASAGFDNNASTLASSPLFLSEFVDAARLVANLAVGVDEAEPVSQVYESDSKDRGGTRSARPYELVALPLGARDGIVVTHEFHVDGEYAITIEDLVSPQFPTGGAQFRNRIVVTVDGQIVYQTSIGGDEDLRTIDQDQTAGADSINERLRDIRFTADAGQREVAVLLARKTHAESENLVEPFREGIGQRGGQLEALSFDSIEITGPLDLGSVSSVESPNSRVFTCYPPQTEQQQQDACAEEIIGSLAARAYGRPLTQREMEERLAYYHAGKDEGFKSGIRRAIVGILASPRFLFRNDSASSVVRADSSRNVSWAPSGRSVYQLDDFALASRLAFFLWSSVPDEELLEVTASGRLSEPAVLERQVHRMLADARAESLATDFAYQWLHLDRMNAVQPDPAKFPDATGRLDPRPVFLQEIKLFIDSIFREDRSVLDLLRADHTFVNETLAWRYGIEGVRGNRFRRIELEDSTRWGLLGKGAILLASSYPNRTSPVLRGEYVMRNILGAPPPPPPPGVETDLDSVAQQESLTVRERLAIHRENPSCNACHGVIDPLGFALESFDVDGSWREVDEESGRPIDASAVLPDGTKIEGPHELREALLERPEQFVQTFVEKLFAYALGRSTAWYDMPAVREVVRRSAAEDYRFSSVVMGIVQSAPFTMYEVDHGESSAPSTGSGSDQATAENDSSPSGE